MVKLLWSWLGILLSWTPIQSTAVAAVSRKEHPKLQKQRSQYHLIYLPATLTAMGNQRALLASPQSHKEATDSHPAHIYEIIEDKVDVRGEGTAGHRRLGLLRTHRQGWPDPRRRRGCRR